MNNFRQDRNNNRNSGFGNRQNRFSPRGDNRSGPVIKHSAICDQCKQNCEVPFRPTGNKPIYCSNCFEGKRDAPDDRKTRRFDNKTSNYQVNDKAREQLTKTIEKLDNKIDKLIEIMENIQNDNKKKIETPVSRPNRKTAKKVVVAKKTTKKNTKK